MTRRDALLITVGFIPLSCHSAAPPSDPDLESATRFVNAFYAWYLPSAQKGSGMQVALHDSSALFSPTLAAALRADGEAQARSPGEIVGLDWDPFLDAQDFCESYEVGPARREGDQVLVEVHGKCSGRNDTLPDVVADLRRDRSTWVFATFRYPRRSSDLLKDLAELRLAREGKD
jgi:hypothetical protein